MNKEKEIEEMAELLKRGFQKSSEEHRLEIHGALRDGAKHYGSNDFKKSMFNYMAEALAEEGYRKADEVRKETAKEIWEDLLGIIDEGYHRPQVNTTISSPFMNGENCAYKVVIVRMKQTLKEKYGVEVDE